MYPKADTALCKQCRQNSESKQKTGVKRIWAHEGYRRVCKDTVLMTEGQEGIRVSNHLCRNMDAMDNVEDLKVFCIC